MARYHNSFHRAGRPEYGPQFFDVSAKPVEHGGLLIYRRLPNCFDIVADGECIGICAGLNGAKRAIDTRFSDRAIAAEGRQ